MLPRGYLILIKHDGRDGSVYPVTTSTCSVGRGLQNDVRIRVQSVSLEHCVIYTSEFQPALLRNLSSSNPTEINKVPVRDSEHALEHGDIITTGERSFRWVYHPQSQYYVSSKAKGTRPLSASSLPDSTGMVDVPISVLQNTLGSQPFNKQSVDITERKMELSPALVAANRQSTASGDVSISPSKLVAVVSPQRRPQSEKKAAEATNVSLPAGTLVTASRNQSSAKSVDITPPKRKSNRLYSKSAGKSTGSDDGMKTLQHERSLQALVTTRKTRKSVGTPQRSRIPRLVYDFKHSRTGTPRSSKKPSTPSGNFKKMAAISSVRKTESEQKQPLPASAEERKRTLESGLRSAARAAKRLKVESPKTPDKKKMAALLVCHGKVSRPKTPQLVSDVPREVSHTSAVKSMRRSMTAASSYRDAVQKSARKKYENVRNSVGDEITSSSQAYSMEIPGYFNFSSGTVHLNVASGEQHQVKDRSVRLSQKKRKSSSLKTEQTVSPGLQEASDLHGVNKRVSPVKISSRRKTQPSTSFNAVHTPAALCPTGRHSATVSADRTHDIAKLKFTVSSAKKIPKPDMRKSWFKQLLNKSVQSTSAFSIEKDAEISKPLLSTPHMQRKPKSMTASCPVATFQTASLYSSRKSGKLSDKLSPKSGPNSSCTRKCSSSPEIEQKARLVSPSNTPVYKESNNSRKCLRFSIPESVELSSGSQQTEGKEGSVAPSTCTSKLTASVKKSRTSRMTETAKSDESGSESPRRTGYKGSPVFSSTPAFKQSASTVTSRDAGGVGSSSKSVDQNSTSLGLRKLSGSPAQKDNEMVCPVGTLVLKASFPWTPNSVSSLSSEGPDSSGSRYLESLYVPKSSGKRVQRLSRSETSLNSFSPTTSLSAQGAGILHKRISLKGQVPQSDAYHTYLTSPSSQNTTFDFECVRTPSITLERLVSPLTSNRNRKSLRWQDASTSKERRKSEPVFKKRRISERIIKNVTSSGSSSLHSVPPHFVTSLIDEYVDTSLPKGQEQVSYNNSFSDRVKTRSSSQSASPKFLSIQKLTQKVSRISKTPKIGLTSVSGGRRLIKTSSSVKSVSDTSVVHGSMKLVTTRTTQKLKTDSVERTKLVKDQKSPMSPKKKLSGISGVMQLSKTPRGLRFPSNDLTNISGVKLLMKTPKSPKSPKNLLRNTHTMRKLMTTPKSPKSPKNDLRDVRGLRKLMTTPKSPKPPKNDLSDVRGVRKLMATPKSPKSPKNDLSDVRGVRKLMATPKSPKPPKNDLRDVRGVRKLMTTPKSRKSPKNDLRDTRGVKRLMKTPKIHKSPKNDLRDVHGLKMLMASPKGIKYPVIDLTDIDGVRRLTPQANKSLKYDLTGIVGGRVRVKTSSPSSSSKSLTDTNDVHVRGNTSLPPQSPEFGGHSSLAESTQKSPQRSIPQGSLPSVVTGIRTRHGITFTNKVPEADRSTKMNVDQKTVPMPKDIKRYNTRSMRSRKEPNLGILQAADISPRPHVRKPRHRKNEKTGSLEDLSPGRNLEISPGHIVTSVATRGVHFNILDSPSTPGDKVERGKNIATNVEVEPPSRNKKSAKSKGRIETEESPAQKDTDRLAVSFPPVKRRRGRSLTSATETSFSPTRRKQGAGVSADAEVSSLPKRKQGITAIAKMKSPVRSKRQQGNTASISVEELSPRKRRGGTANTGSEHSSSPKRHHVTVTEDNGDTADSAALTSRRRRGAAVTVVETLHLPVASDKQPEEIDSPSPPGKRKQQGTKPVDSSSSVSGRKLRGKKLSVVGEEEKVSSATRTRNKPRVTSSLVSKAKSPRAMSRRGGRKTEKKDVSPQLTTRRQTRAASRRKK